VPRRLIRHYGTTISAVVIAAAMVTAGAAINRQADERIREGQVEACERGNALRLQMAEDNALAIQAARAQLAGGGLTAAEREALQASVTRRVARAEDLAPYPCHTLR